MADHKITPDLAPFTNRHKWEQYLTDAQRYRLALYRSVAAEDEELKDAFFIEYEANREGSEFLDALDEAGDDPVARAEALYQLHLGSYPFWLGDSSEAGGEDLDR